MSLSSSIAIRCATLATISATALSACSASGQTTSASPSITETSSAVPFPSPSAQPTGESGTEQPDSHTSSEESPEGSPTAETSAEETPTGEASAELKSPANDDYKIDPAAITTTELTTGEPAETAPYLYETADQPALVFQTPDPQIACLMQPYGAFCMTDDSVNWVLLSVSMKPGDAQPRSIQAQGRAATHDWFQTGTVLPEGQSLEWMGMTCTSTGASSVQCHDGSTGFNLSDEQGR